MTDINHNKPPIFSYMETSENLFKIHWDIVDRYLGLPIQQNSR